MVSSSQIRDRLAAYLDKRIDLESFEDWFVEHTWNIHKSDNRAAESLTFAIEESLSEYSSGHLTEEKLKDELRSLAYSDTKRLEFSDAPHSVWHVITSSLTSVFAPSPLKEGYVLAHRSQISHQTSTTRPPLILNANLG